jgi:hypothetical protein
MSAPSILNLVSIIETIALSHPAVKEFATGEQSQVSLAGNSKAVHVWLEQPFRRKTSQPVAGNMTRRYSMSIMVLDIPLKDRTDELQLISNCDLIADWIALRLRENPPTLLRVFGDWDVISYTGFGSDLWCGVRMELTIETPIPLGACDVRNYPD